MKRNGFKERFLELHPFVKVQLSGRLLMLILAAVTGNVVLAMFGLFLPIVPMLQHSLGLKIKFKKDGLEGDNLALINSLEARMEALPDIVSREEIMTEVRGVLKDIVDENGKAKFDVNSLAELLGDSDKGFRSILKAQGEKLSALELRHQQEEAIKLDVRKAVDLFMEKHGDELEGIIKGRREGQQMKLNIREAVNMTTDNTITGHSSLPDDLLESFSVGAFVPKRQPREYVFDLASRTVVSELSEYKTWLEEGDEEGAFAVVQEGAVKPLVSATLVRNFAQTKKVAGKQVVTEEFQKFRQEAYNIISRIIRQKLLRDYAATLTTDLLSDAAPYTASALDNQYDASKVTDYHAIAAVAAQIEALDFMPDMLVMNPQDKWRIGMSSGENGQFYLAIPSTSPSGQTQIMGFTLRTSNKVEVGKFLLGESGLWEIEEEGISIRMGYGIDVTGSSPVTAVSSDFDNNRFRVIVELFYRSFIATNNQGSFVHADFDDVKAAVTAP